MIQFVIFRDVVSPKSGFNLLPFFVVLSTFVTLPVMILPGHTSGLL